MQNFLRHYISIILAVALLSLVFMFEQWIYIPQLFNPNYSGFQKEIIHQETELQNSVATLQKALRQKKYFTDKQSTLLFIDSIETTQLSVSAFIFRYDSLVFWNNNQLEVGNLYSLSPLKGAEKGIVRLNNGWYQKQTGFVGEYTIVALSAIKKEYPYQNKFLQNRFQSRFEKFDMSADIRLSEIPITAGVDIYNSRNEYLFSLKKPKHLAIRNSENHWLVIGYFAGFLLVLVFGFQQMKRSVRKKKQLQIFLIPLVIISLRILIGRFPFPEMVYAHRIFDPILFADEVFPSLGNLILTIWVIVFISRTWEFILIGFQKIPIWLNAIILLQISVLFLQFIIQRINSIVLHSIMEFIPFQLDDLDIYAVVAFLHLNILALSFIVYAYFSVRFLHGKIQLKHLVPLLLLHAGFIYLMSRQKPEIWIPAIVFYLAIFFIFIFTLKRQKQLNFYFVTLQLFLASVFISFSLFENHQTKQYNVNKLTVNNIATERDNTAEYLLKDLFVALQSDEIIKEYLIQNSPTQIENIYYYLKKKYFDGFWTRYDLEISICSDLNKFDKSGKSLECHNYYSGQELYFGTPIVDPYVFFIDDLSGTITYLIEGVYNVPNTEKAKNNADVIPDSLQTTLYIELNSRLQTYELGYPELLLDEKLNRMAFKREYSYARYSNNKLINKYGHYNYVTADKVFRKPNISVGFYDIKFDNHIHYVKVHDDQNLTVISSPAITFLDLLIIISYSFALTLMVSVIAAVLVRFKNLRIKNISFKNRLRWSMISILIISFTLIGSVAIYYTISQYKNLTSETLQDKMQSVLMEMDHELAKEKKLDSTWQSQHYENLNELLLRISVVFLSDVNLYNQHGRLIGTSQPEIFSRGLAARTMQHEAVIELIQNKKTFFVHREKIGGLEYNSAYVPFENVEKELIGYINLPYFTKPGILEKQITNQVITFVNIYMVLFLVAIFAAVFLSERITQPLRMLQNSFKAMELDKENEPIEYDYKGNDEIAELVKIYNTKVIQLADSVEKLTKSEREGAWREMAKQIAHEVKNPLTPMKLGVQFLLNSWNNKAPDFETRLKSVTNTIIEQINNLTAIANEFSDFARMSKTESKEMNLIKKIEATFSLFENTANIEISINTNQLKDIYILADPDQISRVFINLIKNAIQAIPEDRKGKITIQVKLENNTEVVTTITDNGTGITDEARNKLFVPNFTTKSSGMGLGLAIVKNIIENSGGDIWFETEKGVGTSFFVKFPVAKTKNTNKIN